MTDWHKMTTDEVSKRASAHLNADDDWGVGDKMEAQNELERRRRLKAEIDAQKDKIDFPNGHPIDPLDVRLANLLNSTFPFTTEVRSTHPVIVKIIKEFNRKDPTK